jgi:hypothetical protein
MKLKALLLENDILIKEFASANNLSYKASDKLDKKRLKPKEIAWIMKMTGVSFEQMFPEFFE